MASMATLAEVDPQAVDEQALAKLHRLLERKCQAVRAVSGQPCGETSTGYYRTICLHEHVRDSYLCAFHSEAGSVQCRRCHTYAGHACHVYPTLLVMGMDGWQMA
jgi:hypothetical protein